MSEQPFKAPEELVIRPDAPPSFAEIMDFLVPEENKEATTPTGTEATPAPDGGGQPQPVDQGVGGASGSTDAPTGGDAPVGGVPNAGPADNGNGFTLDASTLKDVWGEAANKFEENQANALTDQALNDVKSEYPKYFEAIQKHPRLLVGTEVPSVDGQRMETLRDAADAKDWQEAMKSVLGNEVRARAAQAAESLQGINETIHSSIDIFRNNVDLIPGTKQFDKKLADEFVKVAAEYEVRTNGKLVGYSIPVQPLIDQVRTRLEASRKTPSGQSPATSGATPTPAQARAAEQPRTPAGTWAPQAGVQTRAGSSDGTGEDIAGGVLGAFLRQNGVTI